MTIERPLLTLALPTYNRAESIRVALESLAAGLRGVAPGRVELLVQDNASDDGTDRIVREFADRHPQLGVRFGRNERNLGYDGNHLVVYREARGEYILFCSDRYTYSLPFAPLLEILAERRPAALTFSDRFRSIQPSIKGGLPGATHDDWLVDFIGQEHVQVEDAYLRTTAGAIVRSGALRFGYLVQNVSDVIVRRDEDPAFLEKLAVLDGDYLLVVGAMCHAFEGRDDEVVILRIPWFSWAFQRMNSGGQRHNNLRVAYGHVALARLFPFLGSVDEAREHQFRILLRTWLPIASGAATYDHRFTMKDIARFAREVGVEPRGAQRLLVESFENVDSPLVLRSMNTVLETAVAATRLARRSPALGSLVKGLFRRAGLGG